MPKNTPDFVEYLENLIMQNPLISIVVVHYGDVRYLITCLESLKSSTYKDIEVIVVDNNPNPVAKELPVPVKRYIHNGKNHGFAGACNIGIDNSEGKFIFILNNDITVDDGCIERLVSSALNDEKIAVLQPKMLDMKEDKLFHSSAGGGMMDIFGYPFSRGRIFEYVETDRGQYDDAIEVFWCSGAALFARKDVLKEAGPFDEDFFLYMEEIDLQWRIHLLGYRIVYIPDAIIYHEGSPSLNRYSIERMYFVHRNNLMMLIKNTPTMPLCIILSVRLLLELSSIFISLLSLKPGRAMAIFRALVYITRNIPSLRRKRRFVRGLTRVTYRDIYHKMYHGSVMIKYSLFRKRKFLHLKMPVNRFSLVREKVN